MLKLKCAIKNYNWGSHSLAQNYFKNLEREKIAELWIGEHIKGPAQIIASSELNSSELGKNLKNKHLNYMLKIIVAGAPLSLQVHPNKKNAKIGFQKEKNLSLNDTKRSYADDNEKSEMVYALTEFDALAGFKPLEQIKNELEHSPSKLAKDILNSNNITDINTVFNASKKEVAEFISTSKNAVVNYLEKFYKDDAGIVIASMLNYYKLKPGEGLYLPAGILHSYIKGLASEVMTSSDNVLRGGLTNKFVNIKELTRVLDKGLAVQKFVNNKEKVFNKHFEHWNFYAIKDSVKNLKNARLGLILAGSYNSESNITFEKADAFYLEKNEILNLKANSNTSRVIIVGN
jgi:mannose-6-phosphate isomerase